MLTLAVGPAEVRFTDRSDGDMGHHGRPVERVAPEVERRRRAVVDRPWSWLRQVHGRRVVPVHSPGDGSGQAGDALVTDVPGCALAVLAADCAPVVLVADEGVAAAVHVGWRGLVVGVLDAALAALHGAGARTVHAVVGPCIRAECYEFGADDLDLVASRAGPTVRAITAEGRPALDLAAGVASELRRLAVEDVDDVGVCTACSPSHFSFRARGDLGRQAGVVWLP